MKTKQISREKYIETFCRDIRIRDRQVLYVSAQTHAKMKIIAHQAMLEELREEQHVKFIESLKTKNDDE